MLMQPNWREVDDLMKIFFGLFFLNPDAVYPLSVRWCEFMSERISALGLPCASIQAKYGSDCSLIFRVNAECGLREVRIHGPTYFRRQRDVEFTIVLPHTGKPIRNAADCAFALSHLFNGTVRVLRELGVDPANLEAAAPSIVAETLQQPLLFAFDR
jgi:hypothetical protein